MQQFLQAPSAVSGEAPAGISFFSETLNRLIGKGLAEPRDCGPKAINNNGMGRYTLTGEWYQLSGQGS